MKRFVLGMLTLGALALPAAPALAHPFVGPRPVVVRREVVRTAIRPSPCGPVQVVQRVQVVRPLPGPRFVHREIHREIIRR
jgi:hypothetical protein